MSEVLSSGVVIWFTGLSGAGKTTIATELTRMIAERGFPVEHLDGDAIRKVFPDTGFTREARDAHIRRVGLVASYLEKHRVCVVASLISPYEDSRTFVRGICKSFFEVYISTGLAVCESRDPKGLYARARRREVANFTGISEPYEVPRQPEITIDAGSGSPTEGAATILRHVERAG
ncbi:MAG: adenylyl-sulfate kinase [Polyangiaceae bacterium]